MTASNPPAHPAPTRTTDVTSRTRSDTSHTPAARIFRTALNLELAGLALQFLLGMYINLYVADPHSQAVVVTHIILGFTLVLCAVITTATAVALRDSEAILTERRSRRGASAH